MKLVRILAWIAFCALGAHAARADQGTVVVAKGGLRPLILWDATPIVTTIVTNRQPRQGALHRLESQSMQILGERAPALRHAKTLTIRLIYQKTGAVSPLYGTATFEGIERVFELTVPAVDARLHAKQFADALAHANVPPGVVLDVTGKLPPI